MKGALCPTCRQKGRSVEPITLRSLLREEALERIDHADGFLFCPDAGCSTSYFSPAGDRFDVDDVSVPIFQKTSDPSRLVCYCFEHRVDEIQGEVERTGSSVVPDEIAAKCKAGLDRCAELNPQGTCCLGNVHRVVREATAHDDAVEAKPCCGTARTPEPEPEPPEPVAPAAPAARTGLFASSGAVVAAVLSSACCWLPLVLIGTGASAVGVAGFFERFRWELLGATVVLLAIGFYLVYRPQAACEPGSACETPRPRVRFTNKLMLWVATFAVVLFAAFPNYVGVLVGTGEAAAVPATKPVVLQVEGMTCAGCETNVHQALMTVDGVRAVEVSYADRRAKVFFDADGAADVAELSAALEGIGYRGTPLVARTVRFAITGMTCASCVPHLEKALAATAGVQTVDVSYEERTAKIVTSGTDESIVSTVEAVGYSASIIAGS